MSHVTLIHESCHTHAWVMSHSYMGHVTLIKWVMSHAYMSHVTLIQVMSHESCHNHTWVMPQSHMNHATLTHESCHAHQHAQVSIQESRRRWCVSPRRTTSGSSQTRHYSWSQVCTHTLRALFQMYRTLLRYIGLFCGYIGLFCECDASPNYLRVLSNTSPFLISGVYVYIKGSFVDI